MFCPLSLFCIKFTIFTFQKEIPNSVQTIKEGPLAGKLSVDPLHTMHTMVAATQEIFKTVNHQEVSTYPFCPLDLLLRLPWPHLREGGEDKKVMAMREREEEGRRVVEDGGQVFGDYLRKPAILLFNAQRLSLVPC